MTTPDPDFENPIGEYPQLEDLEPPPSQWGIPVIRTELDNKIHAV